MSQDMANQLPVITLWGNQSPILDCRTHGEVISLSVANPHITEWLYAGNLSPDSSQMPSAYLTVYSSLICEMLPIDGGHFITELATMKQSWMATGHIICMDSLVMVQVPNCPDWHTLKGVEYM